MLIRNSVPLWKSTPFIRLLAPLIIGIVLQWQLQFSLFFIAYSAACFLIAFLLFRFLPLPVHFKVQWLQGFTINLLLIVFGLFITWQKDIRNHANWFGNYYQPGSSLVVQLDEQLVEKPRSFKANASVVCLIDSGIEIPCKGKIILYFKKDSVSQRLQYGDELIIHKTVASISNTDSAGFDYAQYESFRQTFHTVFLKDKDWTLLSVKDMGWLDGFVFKTRQHILSVLQAHISNDENEQAIAAALLIGYNSDVDKGLKQAYANTGIVYLISISGMSLGLIYLLLGWILSKIPGIRKAVLTRSVVIICCLWLFALLTGCAAGALRSALMLTCIVVGKAFNKKTTVYNPIAVSAFILLCYDPYFIGDIGFQISYLAVISIIVFQKSIYNFIYIKNKWLDKIWQMIAVTLSVQILTLPICIYYFHQFPVLFLITNLMVIPLATIILVVELFLLVSYWLPFLSAAMGKCIFCLIGLMNKFILWINSFPFAVINNLSPPLIYILILYAVIISLAVAFIYQNKTAFKFSLFFTLLFVMTRAVFLYR